MNFAIPWLNTSVLQESKLKQPNLVLINFKFPSLAPVQAGQSSTKKNALRNINVGKFCYNQVFPLQIMNHQAASAMSTVYHDYTDKKTQRSNKIQRGQEALTSLCSASSCGCL